MTLTAEEIQTQQFHARFRGFDVDEVDAFLEKVAEHYLLLATDNKKLQERIDTFEEEMIQFKSHEKTFQNAFLSAQKIADEMQVKSKQEVDDLLDSSRREAERIQTEAEERVASLDEEIGRLQGKKDDILGELRQFLQFQMDAIDGKEDSNPYTFQSRVKEEESATEKTGADTDDDLDDLYQKIELPDLDDPANHDQEKQEEPVEDVVNLNTSLFDSPPVDQDEDDRDQPTMPDLDGDMLFSLADPLDQEHEPAVVIDDEESEDEKDKNEEK